MSHAKIPSPYNRLRGRLIFNAGKIRSNVRDAGETVKGCNFVFVEIETYVP